MENRVVPLVVEGKHQEPMQDLWECLLTVRIIDHKTGK